MFRLSSGKALKVAMSLDKGISQNRAEIDISSNPKVSDIIAKVIDFADDYSWIISELVRPLSEGEFGKTMNIASSSESIFHRLEHTNVNKTIEYVMDVNTYYDLSTTPTPEFVNFLKKADVLFFNSTLKSWDILERNLGKTVDGRIVILDYGIDADTDKLY